MTKPWLRGAIIGAFCVGLGLGFAAAWYASAPVPAPTSRPPAAAVPYGGHLTVTYVDQLYAAPAAAAVRDSLAGVDWRVLDTTFRAYTHGQDELKTLGFTTRYSTADLPIVFIQVTQPTGQAPIIDEMKGPTSADVVVNRVKALRGAAP
jgi:hypothetical protein